MPASGLSETVNSPTLHDDVGRVLAYRAGIRPTLDYQPAARPRLTRLQLLAAMNRIVGYGLAGSMSAFAANQRANALGVGLKVGLVIGVVTTIANAPTFFIECSADHMPKKCRRVFGVALT
jgi:hypothetical protein